MLTERGVAGDGREEAAERRPPEPSFRQSDPAADDRQRREDHERHRHDRRRLVHVVRNLGRGAQLAEEGQEEEPEHVERGETRGERTDRPERVVPGAPSVGEDLVLTEEAGETGRAGDRERADEERPPRDRHLFAESAHLAHVLLAAHSVDDAARAEEEQRLEERVRHHVEDRGRERADAERKHHEAELAHRRVREHLLDVGLHQGDRRREERGRRADDRHDLERERAREEHDVEARDHVDARGHHRRGVDQGGDRCRSRHGVGQPDVERQLRRLAGGADEEEERDRRRRLRREQVHVLLDVRDVETDGTVRRRAPRQEEQAENEPEVADAVHHERFLAGGGVLVLLVPEPDEQV